MFQSVEQREAVFSLDEARQCKTVHPASFYHATTTHFVKRQCQEGLVQSVSFPATSQKHANMCTIVTGASSGFGYATTVGALQRGDKVVATLRTPSQLSELGKKYDSKQLLILKLDVTKQSEIESTFSEAKKHFGRIDVLFSNAGSNVVSEVEGTPEKKAREIFDVLFWGATNVTREAVKCFKEQKPIGGKVLQISSTVAVKDVPGVAYYSAA